MRPKSEKEFNVLYIDDCKMNLEIIGMAITAVMTKGGHKATVELALDSEDGFALLLPEDAQNTKFDLAIVDMNLGNYKNGSKKAQGEHFINKVRNDKRVNNLPIIIYSSEDWSNYANKNKCSFFSKGDNFAKDLFQYLKKSDIVPFDFNLPKTEGV